MNTNNLKEGQFSPQFHVKFHSMRQFSYLYHTYSFSQSYLQSLWSIFVIGSFTQLLNLCTLAFLLNLSSVVFISQSQSGSTQCPPCIGCHLSGCAPIKGFFLGVNSAAAEQRGRVKRPQLGSQAVPRPGGFEAPQPNPNTGGLGQPTTARESQREKQKEQSLYQKA